MPQPTPSHRALITPPSPIRKLAGLAREAEDRGLHVYRLNIGQPDLPSPSEFIKALQESAGSIIAYEGSQGSSKLLAAWSKYINRDYKIGLTPNQMLITSGASEALIFSFMVCCDPGDEILVFDPTYANYVGFAAISGVRLVPVPCALNQASTLPSKEEIATHISAKTRAILICNPNNPTGGVCSDTEQRMLLELCHQHNLFLIADETYREFVYDDLKPRCIFELSPEDPRIIVVDSLSKRFSLCGARIGCLITWHPDLMRAASHIAQARLAAATIDQEAAARMLTEIGDEYLIKAHAEYRARRDLAAQALAAIPGVETHIPGGGFYLLARLPLEDAEDFASFMLREFSYQGATTFVAPAAGFYMRPELGRNAIRIAFVLNQDDMRRAIMVLQKGLEVYRQK